MTGNGYGEDVYGVGTYGLLSAGGGDQIVLDPPEVAEGRVALTLTTGEIRVGEEGPDWGEAALEAFMAEMEIGQVPADVRWPNRLVRIPLLLGALGPAFEAARANLQQKVGLFQREGGWVKRDNLYADVVNASLTMPDKWGWRSLEPEVILTLECIPDFYGDEVTLTSHVEVTNPTLIFVETGIPGDMPGRVSIALNEFQGFPQRGVIWGFRSRHYSAADTAQLRYRAQDMDPLDSATVTALSGSASGSVVRHTNVGTSVWTPVLGTDISDGPLNHTGSYRVWARVSSSSDPGTVRLRFVWDVGDLANPTTNDPVTIGGRDHFYPADLGEIRLDASPVGDHRWGGQIQALAYSGTGVLNIDDLWFQPTDEGAGVLRAPLAVNFDAFSSYAARDDFHQTAGPLNGKTLVTGGTWATSGDSDDLVVSGGGVVQRTAVSDTLNTGRLALAGTGTAALLANQIWFSWSAVSPSASPVVALHQRWVDASNGLYVQAYQSFGSPVGVVVANLRVGGSVTELGRAIVPAFAPDVSYALFVVSDTAGNVLVQFATAASRAWGEPVLYVADSRLAAGGSLASGRHGFYDDYSFASPASTRTYSSYAAWVPEQNAVMHAGRALEIRTDGVFHEGIDATRFGEVADVEGDLPKIPVAGLEGRFAELFVKASRGDFRDLPDSGVDNIVGTIRFRPSFIFPR